MSNLRITINAESLWQTNCLFLINAKTNETIIIDPGTDAYLIKEIIKKESLTPKAVFLTHGHFDHITSVEDLKTIYNIPVYAAAAEKELLSNASMNRSIAAGAKNEVTADNWLNDADTLDMAGFKIKTISTPGHTAGSVCYYLESEKVLISGDTLFKDGVGRTDLPTGDTKTLYDSIEHKLFTLPEDTRVYPGHGDITTISREKRAIQY